MNTATRVGAFGAGLVVAFSAALGAGLLVGPLESASAAASHAETSDHGASDHGTADHGDEHGDEGDGATTAAPAGLSATDQGYRLVPGATTIAPSAKARVTFRILGADGKAVTAFTTAHEKKLHLIVVRRDLSGFQHVHPTMASDGTWSVDLDLIRPGQWRMFADFDPEGPTGGLVLGTDLAVPGNYAPEELPRPQSHSVVDGYVVRVAGAPSATGSAPLNFLVQKVGGATDLKPYLGADGHLVVLREGDLAYAHAHPVTLPAAEPSTTSDTNGFGRHDERPISFQVEAPGPGRYRMFLDFKAGGTVHTAAFTADAEGTTP